MAKKKEKELAKQLRKARKALKAVSAERDALKKALKKAEKREKKLARKVEKRKKPSASSGPGTAAAEQGDDLRKLRGLGPKIEQYLHEAGVYTYNQLLQLDAGDWEPILRAAGPRYRSYDLSAWQQQARELSGHNGSRAKEDGPSAGHQP